MHGVPSYERANPICRTACEELTKSLRFLDEPGSRFRYSGGGFILLEVILEDITGSRFNDNMTREVLDPLGMWSSTFEPYHEPFESRMAMGFHENGDAVGWRRTNGLAAAWLHTTPSDMARFLITLWRASRSEKEPPDTPVDALTRAARALVTPTGEAPGRYGAQTALGIFLTDTPAGRVVFHGGSNRGYRCGMWLFLATGHGLVVMTNSANGRELCNAVFSRLFPDVRIEESGAPKRRSEDGEQR